MKALGATVNKASEFTHAVALGYGNLAVRARI